MKYGLPAMDAESRIVYLGFIEGVFLKMNILQEDTFKGRE